MVRTSIQASAVAHVLRELMEREAAVESVRLEPVNLGWAYLVMVRGEVHQPHAS